MSIKDGPGEGTWSVFAEKVVEQRDAAREEVALLRRKNELLRTALEDIREWAKHDDFIRFDDGDISLADYCTRALHGGK